MPASTLLFHDVFLSDPRESGFVSAAADRYKLSLPAFERQLAGLARVADQSSLVITVDDGGVSYYTAVADRLEAMGLRGYCLVSTRFIGQRGFLDPAQIRDLHGRGHVIGSHSATHPARFSALSPDEMRREWQESRLTLEDLLGSEVAIASVPGGYYSRRVADAACDSGIRTLFTSEPTTTVGHMQHCRIVGRFTIRQGDHPDAALRFVLPAPWARATAWASWNAKGLVKPLLGPSYVRLADWLLAGRGAR